MPPDPTDDDAENLAAFGAYLEKLGPAWLDKIRPPAASPSSEGKPSPEALTLESFLQTALKRSEETATTLREQLEEMASMLTPDQLTLLRSQRQARLAQKEKPEGPTGKPAAAPPPPAKKGLRFL